MRKKNFNPAGSGSIPGRFGSELPFALFIAAGRKFDSRWNNFFFFHTMLKTRENGRNKRKNKSIQ
jgi:hypothetical protein